MDTFTNSGWPRLKGLKYMVRLRAQNNGQSKDNVRPEWCLDHRPPKLSMVVELFIHVVSYWVILKMAVNIKHLRV